MSRRLSFERFVRAPVPIVWHTMLDDATYRAWTAAFTSESHYVGSWDAGASIRFLDGKGSGMVSEIAEHRAYAFLSIRHLGYINAGVDDTTSDAVRAWAPAYENYTFAPVADGTKLTVEMDVSAEFEEMMGDMWPRALDLLQQLAETTAEAALHRPAHR
jgi:hypothetical protein